MHSVGASRKRFFTIFFIKRNAGEKEALFVLAGCDPAVVENTSEEGNYLDADSLD
jgi:hypothetical protein